MTFEKYSELFTLVPRGARHRGRQGYLIYKRGKLLTPSPHSDPERFILWQYEHDLRIKKEITK